jgi:hypothetical protein
MSKKGQFVKGGQQSPEIKAKIKAAKTRHTATAQTRSDKIMAAGKRKRLEAMKT